MAVRKGTGAKVSMGVAVSNSLKGWYIIQLNLITINNVRIEDGNAFLWRSKIYLMITYNHGILEK